MTWADTKFKIMDFEQIKELVKLIQGSNISEFSIEQKNVKLNIRTSAYNNKEVTKEVIVQPAPMPVYAPMMPTQPMSMPQATVAPTPATGKAEATDQKQKKTSNYIEIKSPMVGTFYRSSSPEKPSFVTVGDVIAVGDILCLVEAMKLFNEVKSEVAGRIVKVLVDDASPVEYEQVLFLVETLG